jgi:purine catabolism regulator
MPLRVVLTDPTLADAHPVVRAGANNLDRPVTWVHTSEVLDIASLLRGGELLLVGGVSLATATADERRAYIRELAEVGAAGIALETGTSIPAVPEEMITEAERVGLTLIQLERVVRFVEVTQAVNGQLVNESVRRLQLADQVGHALATELAEGGETADLLTVLAEATNADCVLTTPTGQVIAEAGPPVASAGTNLTAPLSCPITSAGVTVAVLTMTPRTGTDLLLLHAAADRAPEALGLSLLRSRPLTRIERDTHEFLTLARKDSRSPQRFSELADRLGIATHSAFVSVIAHFDRQINTLGLDEAMRRGDRRPIGRVTGDTYEAIVALGKGPLGSARSALAADLTTTPFPPGTRVIVGPGTRNLAGITRCLQESALTFDLVGHNGVVIDAANYAVERLLTVLKTDTNVVDAFITEQIGDLLASDTRLELFTTLHAYLKNWANKTDAAAELHLQRQSLYQRLTKVLAALGDPPPESGRWPGIRVAVELEHARRRTKPIT